MLSFGFYHLLALPKPLNDGATETPGTSFIKALGVMALVVALPIVAYLAMYYSFFAGVQKAVLFWSNGKLPFAESVLTFITIGLVVLVIWLLLLIRHIRRFAKEAFSYAARASHVPFDEVFASFVSRPGIGRMVAFLLVYRLGEALLVKMSGPFLIKPVAEGGMGLSSAQYGLAYGTVGIVAMTIGGILGGVVASQSGLKRWIWVMCFAINIPDALYIYLAYAQPAEFWKVLVCVSGESFGYGFGFTAYMLYMLYIAGTGEHKTSHFALCTGFMALGMMLPGMVSGDIAESLVKAFPAAPNLGWTWFFVIVCIATIPGFLMLPIIPLDREFGRRSNAESATGKTNAIDG
jgi:PAT family beta-lactamase induction signal transducer AmpG